MVFERENFVRSFRSFRSFFSYLRSLFRICGVSVYDCIFIYVCVCVCVLSCSSMPRDSLSTLFGL